MRKQPRRESIVRTRLELRFQNYESLRSVTSGVRLSVNDVAVSRVYFVAASSSACMANDSHRPIVRISWQIFSLGLELTTFADL